MTVLSDKRKHMARVIQADIPLVLRPYDAMGETIGASGREVIRAIEGFYGEGLLRKFGAVAAHRTAPAREHALVLWAVPRERCDEVGPLFAACREITHCYERCPAFPGGFTLFTMVHAYTDTVPAFVASLSERADVGKYLILESREEFKKTSMEYF